MSIFTGFFSTWLLSTVGSISSAKILTDFAYLISWEAETEVIEDLAMSMAFQKLSAPPLKASLFHTQIWSKIRCGMERKGGKLLLI